MIQAIRWDDGKLHLLDQRHLPHKEEWLTLTTWEEVRDAIRDMVVRGAPAIGVTAAYGMAIAARSGDDLRQAHDGLAASRPTAVNLFWALERIEQLEYHSPEAIEKEAIEIESEDRALCQRIGELGAALVPEHARILTICNTGSLATAGIGTALGIIRTAHVQGKVQHVYSCETRPRQQGLKLTAWELLRDGIPFQSIPDSAAASLMQAGNVDFVVAGADRIAANGDSANKIGTLMLAICAKRFDIPFVIAAPTTTIDSEMQTGAHIPIEERDPSELTEVDRRRIAPEGCPVFNPGFDVTPADLISNIVTELGVFSYPYNFS
ncbi:MAG: S-methyl-5-thioribose-1-phosphate isomerase [Armatimonadetes bacterium]|nr:S-methyl-5-thioribose-1-phosphate isomerase [Armatimonadota bacterium]